MTAAELLRKLRDTIAADGMVRSVSVWLMDNGPPPGVGEKYCAGRAWRWLQRSEKNAWPKFDSAAEALAALDRAIALAESEERGERP